MFILQAPPLFGTIGDLFKIERKSDPMRPILGGNNKPDAVSSTSRDIFTSKKCFEGCHDDGRRKYQGGFQLSLFGEQDPNINLFLKKKD